MAAHSPAYATQATERKLRYHQPQAACLPGVDGAALGGVDALAATLLLGMPVRRMRYRAKQKKARKSSFLELSRHLVDLKRLELSTSRMRTERSPKRAGFSDDQYPKKVWSLLKPARFL